MASTPPAAKVENEDDGMMDIDEPIVISEGDHESASKQKPSNQTPKDESRKPEPSNKDAPVEIVDDDDDEEEEGDEEAYAVEKVLAHKIGKKSNGQRGFIYKIKWLGFDDPSDDTWEDEENCSGSLQLVDAYWHSVPGGKPPLTASARKRHLSTPASETGSRKRRQTSANEGTPTKDNQKNDYSWIPPKHLKTWEDHVADIETVERSPNGVIVVYLLWNDGHKSMSDSTVVYEKCPQKMLRFYESHLVFRPEEPKVEEIP